MNHNCYFIDTGAYYGSLDLRDQHHGHALRIWRHIEDSNIKLITSNHVLDELATLLARKINYDFASLKMNEIYTDSEIHIERSSYDDEVKALDYFKKYADQKISFTDCISFAIMERLKIKKVFSFDWHFQYLGFELITAKIS